MNSITVIAASDESPTSHAAAIDRTAACLPFPCNKVLLTSKAPKNGFDGKIVRLPFSNRATSRRTYMSIIILDWMPRFVQTDFAIFCQWDGFAINPKHWTDEFLEYDYIGAPWANVWNQEHPERRVGCGGFSLRSAKWLDACMTLPNNNVPNEDVVCCCHELDHFLSRGCKVAPLELAMRFCYEHDIPEFPGHTINDSFGFHWRGHFGSRPDLVEPPKE